MADNPMLDMSDSAEGSGLDENSKAQKISILDHVNDFHCKGLKKSDNFIIDMVSHGINKETNANSRITLQKSLSRKGSQRGGSGAEKKSNSNHNANDRDAILVTSSSPRGISTPEKFPVAAAVGSTDHLSSSQIHHQITITTGNIMSTPDSKSSFRRNSFKRSSSHSWVIDPKRVLLFFATLSSVGTILLIYFTLSLKYIADERTLDYKS